MTWVAYSLLAPVCWTIANIIDKVVLDRWVRTPLLNVGWNNVVGLGLSAMILSLGLVQPTPSLVWLANLAAGALFIVGIGCYFKAVQGDEVSRVVPIYYLIPLAVALLSAIFLGERLMTGAYVGILLLVGGAILVGSHELPASPAGEHTIRFKPAFWWMVTAVSILALNVVLIDWALTQTDSWTVLYQSRWGSILAFLPAVPMAFRENRRVVRAHGSRPIALIVTSETLTQLGGVVIVFALATGVATLVNALASVHPVYVLVATLILSQFFPKILHEQVTPAIVVQKTVGILAIVIGGLLIT